MPQQKIPRKFGCDRKKRQAETQRIRRFAKKQALKLASDQKPILSIPNFSAMTKEELRAVNVGDLDIPSFDAFVKIDYKLMGMKQVTECLNRNRYVECGLDFVVIGELSSDSESETELFAYIDSKLSNPV